MDHMNFGVFIDFPVRRGMTQADSFDESLNLVMEAEKLGIDCVWVAEHHFSERFVSASPIVLASTIAARTSKIRIGTGVIVLPLVNPLRIAEEAATVDHVSKGRFDFGIGRSGLTKYYQGFNVPYSESRPRFLEALEVIMKAWKEDQFSYQGEFYSYENVAVVPKPYQQPHPPIRIAAAGEDTFTLAGTLGHPILMRASRPIQQLKERVELFRQARREAGHDGHGDVALTSPVYVAEDSYRALSDPEASTMAEIRYTAEELIKTIVTEEERIRLQNLGHLPYRDILQQRVMYGTFEAVVERIQEYRETLGINGLVLETNYGGQIPNDRVLNSIRLIAEKVMPEFK